MAKIPDIPASSSTIATTRWRCQKTLHGTVYTTQCELPTGKLPVQKDVVLMLHLLHPDQAAKAMHTINEAAVLLSNALIEHWHSCNVYTIAERHIVKKTLWCLQWVQEQLSNQNWQKNWKVKGKNVHVQPPVEINTIWYFYTRLTM